MVTLDDAKAVAQAVDPVCIVVFGSVAREGRGRDLDLLIVAEDQAEDAASLFQRVHKHLKSFYSSFAIDPFVVSRSTVRRHLLDGSPFLRMIQRQGRCLYMKESAKQWVNELFPGSR